MSERESEVIYVQSKHLGLIIGRGGSTIKEISQETGCRINIKKDEAQNDETPISLEGSSRNIAAAKAKIGDITERGSQRRNQDGGDRGYGNNDRGYNSDRRQRREDDRDGDRSYGRSSNDRNYSRGSGGGYSGGSRDQY